MQINGAHQVHGSHALKGPHFNQRPQHAAGPNAAQKADQLDISPAAQAASESGITDGIRTDLVARLRSEIQSGTYETADKLDAAVDRMFDALG